MKDEKKPRKPAPEEATPVKEQDGKGACPLRVEDILKVLGAGGG